MSWGGCPDLSCPGVLDPDRTGAAIWPRRFVLLAADEGQRAVLHEVTHAYDRAGEDLRCTQCDQAFTEVVRRGGVPPTY